MQNDSRPPLPLYTYLARFKDMLKIGQSHHPGKRRASYGLTGNWTEPYAAGLPLSEHEAELLAVIPSNVLSEFDALAMFRHHRIKGREWFTDHSEIRSHFESLRPQFVPSPWRHRCVMFWRDDPRIPADTRQRMDIVFAPQIRSLFRPIRKQKCQL